MVVRLFQNSDFLRRRASKTLGKMAYLLKRRTEICQKNRIELYNALIRSHLENSIQAWAFIKDKKLEKFQTTLRVESFADRSFCDFRDFDSFSQGDKILYLLFPSFLHIL